MLKAARDRIEGALGGIAAAALVGALACSAEPKKDVDVPLDTTVLTSGPVDTSGLTADGPGRVVRAQPTAEGSGVRAGGARGAVPTEEVRPDARNADRGDSDEDSDRKGSGKKKGKGKGKKSR